MMMEPFHAKFSEIAEEETRCVIIPQGKKLPAGEYFMVESFCNDSKCDCRRAFINILYRDEIILATIGFGWEDLSFYKKWAHDKSLAQNMKGPILELGGVSSKYSDELLVLFKEVMLNDQVFLDRIKRHYKMFKDAIQ